MPRGHLKHQKTVSRKVARGGSSRSFQGNRNKASAPRKGTTRKCWSESDGIGNLFGVDSGPSRNDWIDDEVATKLPSQENFSSDQEGQCIICCEEKPLVFMTRACKHRHQDVAACYECYRELYVVRAQQDITNYPLRCFHPSCGTLLDDNVLKKNNILRGETEWSKHHRLVVLAKSYRRRGGRGSRTSAKVTHCPACHHPHLHGERSVAVMKRKDRSRQPRVPESRTKDKDPTEEVIVHTVTSRESKPPPPRKFTCRQCRHTFTPPDDPAKNPRSPTVYIDAGGTVTEVATTAGDWAGGDDGWAPCPYCHLLISKGDGCDHIACPCGNHFYWWDARTVVRQLRRGR